MNGNMKKTIIMLALDLENALDLVWQDDLIHKLGKQNLSTGLEYKTQMSTTKKVKIVKHSQQNTIKEGHIQKIYKPKTPKVTKQLTSNKTPQWAYNAWRKKTLTAIKIKKTSKTTNAERPILKHST